MSDSLNVDFIADDFPCEFDVQNGFECGEIAEQDFLVADFTADNFACEFQASAEFVCEFGGVAGGDYEGQYIVTPNENTQTLVTSGKTLDQNITVKPIPNNYGLITYDGTKITVS